ncbi:MAG: hypothetical protein AAGB46_12980 [Verrucomicrobiota bacterium]
MLRILPLALVAQFAALAQKQYELEPINYVSSEAIDPISEYFLDTANTREWIKDERTGYLNAFLEAFEIPIESQVLVFSKTSLQGDIIGPRNPRALYFNEEIYVGWVPGGSVLEISVASPTTGTNFYTIDNNSSRPQLLRETHDCLRCHGGSFTRDIPGHLVRSVFPADSGQPIYKAGTQVLDQTTPIDERWGGYLVTGSSSQHRGNKLFKESDTGAGFASNYRFEDVPDNGYIGESSDVVALLILEHQAQAHNLIANVALQTRRAFHDQKTMDKLLQRTEPISDSTRRRIKQASDKLLEYLFFKNEAELTKLELSTSAFARAFQEGAIKDKRGRSLRDLKMDGSMFRFPLSYLIYSHSFNALPSEALDYLWSEIDRILKSEDGEKGYEHLSRRDKRNIQIILRETHPTYTSESDP